MSFFRKQKYLIDFTLSSLQRRKGKNIGLLVVYSLIVFMLASVMLFTQALRKEANLVLQQSPEIIVQRMVAGRHDLIPADYLEKMGRLRGVTSRSGRLWGYYYDPAVKANYTLMSADHKNLERKDSETVETYPTVIGAGIARTRGIGVGDYFSFYSPAQKRPFMFKVREILSSESELISADLFLVSEDTYRKFFGLPDGVYTDLVLTVKNQREVRNIAQKVIGRLPDTRPILRDEILRTYDSIFSWRQGIVFILLTGSILAFVIFAWDKASGLSAEEKREIGILKAVGWETGDVLRMKFWEGAIISLGAFLLGYLLAYAHVFFASGFIFAPVLKGWAVLYPDFRLKPHIDGLQLATLFFFTVIPYTVATIVPIWRSSIVDPDVIMR